MAQTLEPILAQEALEAAPVGVAVVSVDKKIHWANNTLSYLLGGQAVTAGEPAAALMERRLTPLSDSAEYYQTANGERRLQRVVREASGGAAIWFFLDVTAQASLEQELEAKETHDPLTRLLNRRAVLQALESQVSRSRRYHNPLAAVAVRLSSAAGSGQPADMNDAVLLAVSYLLRDQLRWVDQVGRSGEREFLLVLPETAKADAVALADKLRERLAAVALPDDPDTTLAVAARFAVTQWSKGDDVGRILGRLEEALAVEGEATGIEIR